MISDRAIAEALIDLSIVKFFPSDKMQQTAIMRQIKQFVSEDYQLRWLVQQLMTSVPEWPGIVELRGMYCTRFRPADGKEYEGCKIAGFTIADGEAKSVEADAHRYAALEAGRAEELLKSIEPNLKIKTLAPARVIPSKRREP